MVPAHHGQSNVEYALLIATIVVVILIITIPFGSAIGAWYGELLRQVTTVAR